MAKLTVSDKVYLEDVLYMYDTYSFIFNDKTFIQIFRNHGIDIRSQYQIHHMPKANIMRTFWDQKPDALVGEILSEMLDVYKAKAKSGSAKWNPASYKECRKIVARLCGEAPDSNSATDVELSDKGFEMPDIKKLPVAPIVYEIIRVRLDEARRCMSVGAYLSTIIMCGSVLETVLLGVAEKDPEKFNCSKLSPKKDKKVRPFSEWSLANFIDVARDVGLLKADAQSFSHGLRDFRNYIHPAKQTASDFAPRKQTARLCIDALVVALEDVRDRYDVGQPTR